MVGQEEDERVEEEEVKEEEVEEEEGEYFLSKGAPERTKKKHQKSFKNLSKNHPKKSKKNKFTCVARVGLK